jgi:hypothetical protein
VPQSPSPHPGPSHQTHVESDDSGSDSSDDIPQIPAKDKRKQREIPPWDKGKRCAESLPNESEWNPVLFPCQSQRETKVPNKPGNVYSDECPSKILQDYDKQPFLPDKEQQVHDRVPWQKLEHHEIQTPQIPDDELNNCLDDILQHHGVTPPP